MKNHPFYMSMFLPRKSTPGNQLAVFRSAATLDEEMQQDRPRDQLLRDNHLSFQMTPQDGGFDVPYLSPRKKSLSRATRPWEQPTSSATRSSRAQAESVACKFEGGPDPCHLRPGRLPLDEQIQPDSLQEQPEILADILGLWFLTSTRVFRSNNLTGLPFFIVPLKNIAALKKSRRPEKYFELIEEYRRQGHPWLLPRNP